MGAGRKDAEIRRMVAGNLADSDEEDLTDLGREISRGVKAREGVAEREIQSLARGGMVRPEDSVLPITEKRLQGKTVLVERYSRIRITNPQVWPVVDPS